MLIGKRNKPVAVLMNIEKYSQMEATLELLEDFALGYLAKERDAKTKISEYLDVEDVKKRIKGK